MNGRCGAAVRSCAPANDESLLAGGIRTPRGRFHRCRATVLVDDVHFIECGLIDGVKAGSKPCLIRWLFSAASVSRITAIVADNDDADVFGVDLEKKVVGKPLQVASAKAARVEMMALRKFSGVFDRFGQFLPESVSQFSEIPS